MSKIRIVTDTASDIPLDTANKLGIDVLSFMLNIEGESYRELVDMDIDTFYERLEKSSELPTTSQITSFTFEELFRQYLAEGYTDIIYVSINAKGSATNQNAQMAREMFYEENPKAKEKMHIYVVDSRNYTAVYGYPVKKAAEKAAAGEAAGEIVRYLESWFENAAVYFLPMTLKYVKKSGRVSAAAAFAGELMGLKPLIRIAQGETYVIEKIRGEKNIVPKMAEKIMHSMKAGSPYIIVHGCETKYAYAVGEELHKRLGYPPVDEVKIGAAIAINAGPDVAAIAFLEDK